MSVDENGFKCKTCGFIAFGEDLSTAKHKKCLGCGNIMGEEPIKKQLSSASDSLLETCQNCKHQFSKRASKCPKCQQERTSPCFVCKKQIPKSSKSCPECGDPRPFEKQEKATINNSNTSITNQNSASNFSQSSADEPKKNNVTQNSNQPPTDISPVVAQYDKIGGFLILLVIGLVIAPFTYLVDIADTIKVINSGDFELFKDNLKNLMYFNVSSSLFLLAFLFFLMFKFLFKKQGFAKYMAIYYVLNITTAIIILISIDKVGLSNLMESKDLQDMSSSLFKSVFAAIIWVPYLFLSKRAKGTFVN